MPVTSSSTISLTGAAAQRRDRRAARTCLGQHETERLAGLHRVDERAGAAEQRDLLVLRHFTGIHHLPPVHQRGDVLPIIIVLGGGQQQAVPGAPGHVDGGEQRPCLP